MQNLITRTITGAIFVALIISSLILNAIAFAFVMYIIMLVGMIEFYRIINHNDIFPQLITGGIAGSVIYIVTALVALDLVSPLLMVMLPVLIILFFITEFYRNKPNAIQNIAFSTFPLFYISLPMAIVIFLTHPMVTGDISHWHIAFGFFIILWCDDTFAYLTGWMIGRHKFFERISPKKTWEGTIGGVVFALGAAYVMSVFFTEMTVLQWLGAALVVVVSGTLGDLSESLLKRNFNVKDSGYFLPGHGGVLDRFDSVLFSAPALFCYLILLNV